MCELDIAQPSSAAYPQVMRTVQGRRFGRLSCGLAALALGLGAGCAGGQTGDLSGQNGGPGDGTGEGTVNGGGGCEEHKQKLGSFDDMTDAGSAEQLLGYAEGSFDSPITWRAPGQGQAWSVGPESGQGQLHVEVTRGESAYLLTYTQPQQSGSGETTAIGTLCPPTQLGVEAHVSISTEGGALAESYDLLLRSVVPGVATLRVPLDPAKVSGSLEIGSSNPRAKLVQLSLDATLMAEGISGRIAGLEQIDYGSGASGVSSASGAVLAVWPDSAACKALWPDGGGLGLPIGAEALGVSGEDTLASLVPASPAPIRWLGGEQTTLTVSFDGAGDGCFRVSELPVEIGGGPTVSYPVTIGLKSADGKLDGSYAGTVVASGSGNSSRIAASASLQLAVEDVADSGFTSVTVPEGIDGLLLRFDSTLQAGSVASSVKLLGLTNPPCLTEPPPPPTPTPDGGSSAPGCSGQTQTPLESAA